MIVAVEQKSMLIAGGIAEQPTWFISLLAWFGPAYDTMKFQSRAKMILGDDTKSSGQKQPEAFGKQGKKA